MTKRMLIDSTHAEETRVVVLDGDRLDEYDVETSTKQQLKGNIYLAKVVRVEPSLQAAFVEYGGNRHGFLAFGEIHPDYYQIPVADRQRLIELQEAEAREEEEAEDRAAASAALPIAVPEATQDDMPAADASRAGPLDASSPDAAVSDQAHADPLPEHSPHDEAVPTVDAASAPETAPVQTTSSDEAPVTETPVLETLAHDGAATEAPISAEPVTVAGQTPALMTVELDEAALVQLAGELDTEYQRPERAAPKFTRHYQIQEVIRRRQILLIQVVKEERGSKGAALTTYISLAGRFSVLMPNSPRGGGISRKITSATDRRRLKEVTAELELPRGMGLIVRTAGANRPKPEITRDCEYLLNQWDQIRDLTMKSVAPALIYEEASLIKRAIRDVYSRDVDDILVDGEDGWRAARDFMRMLMPTHAKKVQLWKDPQPLFAKAQVEAQLDAMLVPTVQLKSGGYLVINQTEALVAIDVNSGRSTRERSIEDTALRTNLEAADEAARQLRLRDLAGLIVIDFIDMESRRNNAAVEKRLKDALKLDRARIQLGSISHFGLLEMSRQRLRPSLAETSFVQCTHCTGTGTVRSTESAALHVLRAIEEEGGKRRSAEIVVHVAGAVAFYILNYKRQRLAEVEARYGMVVTFAADETLLAPATRIERVRAQAVIDGPAPVSQLAPPEPFEDDDELPEEAATETAGPESVGPESIGPDSAGIEPSDDDSEEARPGETAEEGEQRRGRRRRRRGGRRDEKVADASPATTPVADGMGTDMVAEGDVAEPAVAASGDAPAGDEPASDDGERKRRGRRGGRRRRREPGEPAIAGEAEGETPSVVAYEPAPEPTPAYTGPTPANPFGGTSAYDIFDAIEQAEQERALALTARIARVAPSATETEPAPEPAKPAAEQVPVALEPVGESYLASAEIVPEPVAPEPVLQAPVMPEPVVQAPVAPEPAAPEPVSQAPVAPEPVMAAAEPPPEPPAPTAPAIVPVLISSDDPVAMPKKGWWRR